MIKSTKNRYCDHVQGIRNGDFVGDSATSLYSYLSLNPSVISSVIPSVMSLYDYINLNPSVIPSVKSSKKTPRHHAVASFQTKCIVRRRYGRYIPTDFETEFIPLVIITDIIFSSVIPLVFAGFLVVEEIVS